MEYVRDEFRVIASTSFISFCLIFSSDADAWIKVLVDLSNNLKKGIYPEANATYLQR